MDITGTQCDEQEQAVLDSRFAVAAGAAAVPASCGCGYLNAECCMTHVETCRHAMINTVGDSMPQKNNIFQRLDRRPGQKTGSGQSLSLGQETEWKSCKSEHWLLWQDGRGNGSRGGRCAAHTVI